MNSKTIVLITGADGFIGSHLAENLVNKGYSVKAFCFYNSFGSYGWLDSLNPEVLSKIEVILGDIRDFQLVSNAMIDVDVVYHLAALITIPYSYRASESYIDTNIKGTLNILNAAKTHKVSRVLITSTSEVYGTAQYVPIDENHPKNGQSPYAASKIGADALALSYYKSFDLPVTVVRPFNTYGPRQSIRAIIPTIIIQLLKGKSTLELGNLKPTRDFLFIDDTVSAFEEIANCDDLIGEEVNIASNREISMKDLAQVLIDKINPKAKVVLETKRLRPVKSEVFRLFGDNSKLKQFTNWKFANTFEQGMQKTIDWYTKDENIQLFGSNKYVE